MTIPFTKHRDEDGSWLFFELDDIRILTAFAPSDLYKGKPIALGWAGVPKLGLMTSVWLKAAATQIDWSNNRRGGSHVRNGLRPELRAIGYGTNKNIISFAPNSPWTTKYLSRELPPELLIHGDDAQFWRLELLRANEPKRSLVFSFWARIDLLRDAAEKIPYGSAGANMQIGDLQRTELEDIVAGYIAESHTQQINAADVRSMLRRVKTEFSPNRRVAA